MPRADYFDHFCASRFVGKHGALEPGREFRPSRNNRRIAFRPGGYHPDFNLQLVRNKIQIITRRFRQFLHVTNSRRRFLPSGQSHVLRLDLVQ